MSRGFHKLHKNRSCLYFSRPVQLALAPVCLGLPFLYGLMYVGILKKDVVLLMSDGPNDSNIVEDGGLQLWQIIPPFWLDDRPTRWFMLFCIIIYKIIKRLFCKYSARISVDLPGN